MADEYYLQSKGLHTNNANITDDNVNCIFLLFVRMTYTGGKTSNVKRILNEYNNYLAYY